MIFKPELVVKILAGEKTMTRRPVNFDNPTSHYWHERCRYQPGSKLAIQANYNGPAPARGVVTGLRRERWKDITEADARAEGFGATRFPKKGFEITAVGNFQLYVGELYPGMDWESDCWVIEFELVPAQTIPGEDGDKR